MECYFCKKPGHLKQQCWKYKTWKKKNEKVHKVAEYDNVCFSIIAGLHSKDRWYINSGTTSHITSNKEFFNIKYKETQEKVTIADDKKVEIIGTGQGIIKQKYNNTKERIIPKLCGNLISVKKIIENGCNVQFDEKRCNIIKNNQVIATAECIGN